MKKYLSMCAVLLFICFGAIPAMAQNASLVGTVRDAQQAVIPGAMVTGTGAPVTRACAKSKGTRYTLALSASPSWIMTPAEDMEFSGAKRSRNHFVAPQDFSSPPSTGTVYQSNV